MKAPWSLLQSEQPQLSQPDIWRFNSLPREEKEKITKLTVITKKKGGGVWHRSFPWMGWRGPSCVISEVLSLNFCLHCTNVQLAAEARFHVLPPS